MRLSDIPEHEIRLWCERTGCWASWRDIRDLLAEIDRAPYRNRAAWIEANEIELDRMNLGPLGSRQIARALAAGADTAVGKAIAEHDVRFSSQLNYWLSRATVPSAE